MGRGWDQRIGLRGGVGRQHGGGQREEVTQKERVPASILSEKKSWLKHILSPCKNTVC